MVRIDFITQLEALGFKVQELSNNFISFSYKIDVGKFINKEVEIAFQVPDSFPLTPPHGPHFKPHILPISGGGGTHPYGGIHQSPLGQEWQHWSRPIKEWGRTNKTVKIYLAHIRHILDFE